MKEAAELEFQELKKFWLFFEEHYFKPMLEQLRVASPVVTELPEKPKLEVSPATITKPAEEKPPTQNQRLQGFRQAANDIVEMTAELPPAERARLDTELRSQGIITLSEIRRRYSRAYKRIIKRGEIKDDTEFYLINGVRCDLASDISDAERQQLGELISRYESNVRGA